MCRSLINKTNKICINAISTSAAFDSQIFKENSLLFSVALGPQFQVTKIQNLTPKAYVFLVNHFLTVRSLFFTPIAKAAHRFRFTPLSNRHAFSFTFPYAQVAARRASGEAAAEATATTRAPGARDASATACCTRSSCGCARRTSRTSWHCSRFCSRCVQSTPCAHPLSSRSSSFAPSPPSSVCSYLVLHSIRNCKY